ILVKFSWHIPDFPIYSNGTKPGTLHLGALVWWCWVGVVLFLFVVFVSFVCEELFPGVVPVCVCGG
ncbi:hypothetical protein, partial [Corynebacterium accolens]|uniref:hypothetical protein n=1 Tax=Corynebacterium accolens TaxID=38284 RepID=UPI00254DBA65